MWNKTQLAAFERVVASCREREPKLVALETLAQSAPQFADRVAEIRARHDHARTLAEVALQLQRDD